MCGGKFGFCCGTTVSYICVMQTTVFFLLRISFYVYACPGVFMHLRKTIAQDGHVFDCVTLVSILLRKLSFLHMC